MKREYVISLPYDEIRRLYKDFLHTQNIVKATIYTAYGDSFYLWRKGSKELFWDVMTAIDFESKARKTLLEILSKNSASNIKSRISNYMSHLRRFRLFLDYLEGIEQTIIKKEKNTKQAYKSMKKIDIKVPNPSVEQVDIYLKKWDTLENYYLQEDALNKLFLELCPKNVNIVDVLLKCSTLNDFYSTNIFKIYPIARHILSLDIDSRINLGDVTLVKDIQYVKYGEKQKNFYSFATKYCSHHNPFDFPIYDSYVDIVLRNFRKLDDFSSFQDDDLKDYQKFKEILNEFRVFYDLEKYNLKQIDQYIWLLGKDYFPKKYIKKR